MTNTNKTPFLNEQKYNEYCVELIQNLDNLFFQSLNP
jgi:hypothetical protein